MDRLGSLDPEILGTHARCLYNDEVNYFDANLKYLDLEKPLTPALMLMRRIYIYKFGNGRLVGPFGLELHTPGTGYAWLDMTKSLAEYTSLPLLAREVAILVTAIHEAAEYAMYAHSHVSKLPKADLDMIILEKKCPSHSDEKCQMAFKIATELATKPGPLADGVWSEALGVLGREATVVIVHYCGFYKYVATILNGFAAQLPAERPWG